MIEYRFADAVKLAGHSCPTVASAYLMACHGLTALYGPELPTRGGIRVELAGLATEGVVGVIASVLTLLTGATGQTGFKGLGGHFDRRHLLDFGVPMRGTSSLHAHGHRRPGRSEGSPGSRSRRCANRHTDARCIAGTASTDERTLFQSLWQERVRALLVEHAESAIEIIHA